ncbi:MAG TPA: AbrB/MazE/SpoVT family DNA-binding domain-containing protein [Gemmatimonadaceae bacterium]|jgi:antitoxin component of MazEF toxin-antitoxin module|nr:AbrB/MazE/SpoVT family DNA-binding domain-containing protein [Gemmatimonadaceae bacterium]
MAQSSKKSASKSAGKPVRGAVTTFAFVGNLGCIRFPPEIRKASGIKRGDRLALNVRGPGSIVLLKVADALPDSILDVEGCACANVPEGCAIGASSVLTVGWSYVQLGAALATDLAFLPGEPLKLVGEPSQIAVTIHKKRRDLDGVPKTACPP